MRVLPSFVREHVNRYPRLTDPIESRSDCFWTAFNFFSPPDTVPVNDPDFVLDTFKLRFRPVTGAPTLGNLVVLLDAHGAPVHAALYIADGLVFTKNGLGVMSPWTYMKAQSMIDLYTALLGKVRVVHVEHIGAIGT